MISDMSSTPDEKKKKGPLFWVLTSGAAFLVLLFGGLLIVAYFAGRDYRRQMEAGKGGEFLRKLCLASDPSNEVVDEDTSGSSVHFRNKKTGKEYRCYIDPATNQMKLEPFETGEHQKAPGK